jgi:hypothetical protein
MANTLVLLERITVGAAGASSVTFNSIPQTGYTDLVIKGSVRRNTATVYGAVVLNFNGDTGNNYSYKYLEGNGASASSTSSGTTSIDWLGNLTGDSSTANTFGSFEAYIPNYTSSNQKSSSVDSVGENNAATAYADLTANLWTGTAAISSITITAGSGLLMQYSTFSLYGVSAIGSTLAKSPKALGGSIIETDGTYWYHAFLSSGTFTPATGLSCDILVVAGGGGGAAAGGGAGGVLAFASQSLASGTGYSATVGAGGNGAAAGSGTSTSGGNSQFASLTAAVGGGYGAWTASGNGGNGGSGGGAYGGGTTAGTGTSGQGNNGGGPSGVGGLGSGGGGAGAAGANGNSPAGYGGNGGIGVNTVTNWGALSSVLSTTGLGVSGYIAGGGGGSSNGSATAGSGGTGGGGSGWGASPSVASTAGVANTGGGGGGGEITPVAGSGSNGGSGLIIVRYAV